MCLATVRIVCVCVFLHFESKTQFVSGVEKCRKNMKKTCSVFVVVVVVVAVVVVVRLFYLNDGKSSQSDLSGP